MSTLTAGGTSRRDARRRFVSRLMLTLTGVAAFVTVLPLLLILFHLLRAGLSSMNPAFFTELPAPVGETGGGVGNGVLGTGILVLLAALMGLPVAIGAGLYLAEAQGSRVANTVRFITDVMNGIPSIVIGIFVWSWVVVSMGHFSALAGAWRWPSC
jgi:phosphate transport system permease protein